VSGSRAAAPTEQDGGNYSLIVYGVNDRKGKRASEGNIRISGNILTLKPTDGSGGEMSQIYGKNVNPFKQETGQSGDFKYTTSPGNTITITGYTGNGGTITIPGEINGRKVIATLGWALFTTVPALPA
jgi:cytoskeletal protein CcmA (bactofilin family)